jgi:mycoredoxin-dependent peroxiredoxin
MTLAIGDPAPDFTLKDQYGQDVSLSAYAGKKAVLLVF